MRSGYQSLREGAAWLDLTGRGVIRVTGEDRVRLLHAMTTNHVQQLKPGEWCYAFFLNAQGRMLADVNILCGEDALILDTEPVSRARVFDHLDKFIIADDVELEDTTGSTAVIGVEGPDAGAVLQRAGLASSWDISSTGAPGFRFFVPLDDRAGLIEKLEVAGAVAATAGEANTMRLERAKPRYGDDLSDAHIPAEARLLGAVHFSKGCYLGQEIVERVRSRGRPHRLLTHLEAAGMEPLVAGAKLRAGDKEAGEITSSAYSPAEGHVVALGYVRAEFAAPGQELTVEPGRLVRTTDRLAAHAA